MAEGRQSVQEMGTSAIGVNSASLGRCAVPRGPWAPWRKVLRLRHCTPSSWCGEATGRPVRWLAVQSFRVRFCGPPGAELVDNLQLSPWASGRPGAGAGVLRPGPQETPSPAGPATSRVGPGPAGCAGLVSAPHGPVPEGCPQDPLWGSPCGCGAGSVDGVPQEGRGGRHSALVGWRRGRKALRGNHPKTRPAGAQWLEHRLAPKEGGFDSGQGHVPGCRVGVRSWPWSGACGRQPVTAPLTPRVGLTKNKGHTHTGGGRT